MPPKRPVQDEPKPGRSIQILLAEDCLGDVALVRKALATMQVPTELTVVEDGEQLLHYLVDALRLEKESSLLPVPDVVLVDLNMPKLDGFKALELINEQSSYRHLPLVVISSSSSAADRRLARTLGAHGFIDKAGGPAAFVQQLQFIERIWSGTAAVLSSPSSLRH